MSNATLSTTSATTTTTGEPETVAAPRPTTPVGVKLALAATVLGVLAVLAAGILRWDPGADPSAPAAPVPSGPPVAYLPGGSVYEQQVPGPRHWALVADPGGTVYKAQVPRAR